jgi:hypothetical protein
MNHIFTSVEAYEAAPLDQVAGRAVAHRVRRQARPRRPSVGAAGFALSMATRAALTCCGEHHSAAL